MKTLIGIVTYGNLPFTQLTIAEIRRTTLHTFNLFVIVGKPGDMATERWLQSQGIPYHTHDANRGFPASLNDIIDYARTANPIWHNLIICGNDVVPYPGAIDAMIDTARETDFEWICSSQFDVHSLLARYPEQRKYFEGPNLLFTDFTARPWEVHKDFHATEVKPDVCNDVQNLCLYKRSVFEKIGYFDANFWPGGYFSDNDYCGRGHKVGVQACNLAHSAYFHFWSRTIHQSGDTTTAKHFERNREYYELKWGGPVNGEKYEVPFAGRAYPLMPGVALPADLKIATRHNELAIIQYWSNQ